MYLLQTFNWGLVLRPVTSLPELLARTRCPHWPPLMGSTKSPRGGASPRRASNRRPGLAGIWKPRALGRFAPDVISGGPGFFVCVCVKINGQNINCFVYKDTEMCTLVGFFFIDID